MKRLRNATRIALVSICVCLLMVDPAAACRLLFNRCRCCCCQYTPPNCCTVVPTWPSDPIEQTWPMPAESMPIEPSPSDAPPALRGGAGETPRAPLAAPLPSSEHFRPAPSVTAQPPAAPLVKPTDRVPPVGTTAPRERTEFTPPIATEIAPALPRVSTSEPSVSPAMESPVTPTPRALFEPDFVNPSQPVAPPAFPPVDDDPFAPLPTLGAGLPTAPAAGNGSPNPGRGPQPVDDDPFAPISPPAAQPKAEVPLVVEPTRKVADPLAPGDDGRLPLRHWIDNSGQFQVKARLISILDGRVRLLKETGRTTTVPVERLSAADQTYVAQIIARYGHDLAKLQLAAR
jgi:SLA1 homology domain 1, SHD1